MKRIILSLAAVLATVALAGDEPVTTVNYTGTAACTAILKPNTRYAVQPTTDAHVRVTNDTTNATATTSSVKVGTDKLYDVYTTRTKRYICAIQASANGTLRVFEYQDGAAP